jgi:hypothetical protein
MFPLVLVLVLLGGLGCGRSTGQATHVATANPGPAQIAAPNGASPTKALPRLPTCPPGGLLPLQARSPGTGHHKVTLSWNAGAFTDAAREAVGYCLYRSEKRHAAKQNATCTQCERVNAVPIASISCVDDLVEDSATYYYVVTAINSHGQLSSSSNEVIVPIRSPNEGSSISGNPPPLCRVTPASGSNAGNTLPSR